MASLGHECGPWCANADNDQFGYPEKKRYKHYLAVSRITSTFRAPPVLEIKFMNPWFTIRWWGFRSFKWWIFDLACIKEEVKDGSLENMGD